MSRWLALIFLSGLAVVVGCSIEESDSTPGVDEVEEDLGEPQGETQGGKKPVCALKCAAPPDGCHYENAVLTGPCHKLTCGELVCDGSTI